MRITFAPLLWPFVAAGIAAGFVPLEAWQQQTAKLLPALSVIAAAVLVRLARGLAMPSGESLTLEEGRRLVGAFKTMVRRLRALILVVLATMIVLVAVPPSVGAVLNYIHISSAISDVLERASSAFIGFCLTYVFVRTIQLVSSDVGLVDIQADVLLKSMGRKEAREFEEKIAKSTVAPFKAPEGYGKRIS